MFDLMPFDRPMHAFFDPFRQLDEFERSFFAPVAGERKAPVFGFRTDVKENDNAYVLEAELPGFNKEDISVDITGDVLTVKAEHNSENEENKDNYVRKERYYGSYSRSFNLDGIDADAIEGAYRNGVLTLTLPKKIPEAPAGRKLELK